MISRTTKEFWKLFDALPKTIRNQTVKTYKVWNNNPNHPSLHFKSIHSTETLYSVRISRGYRALGLKEAKAITWFWVGSHTEYEKLISRY
ncbi:MAG: hypothetical protein D8M57_15730 [Candidatus Scalindua sp. AMX11]|nr:MAG: hypothetical protein DWQ00_08035 [Candidatus Scalindua sp.]RZV76765.1 MAG: hypothetical protein EX341_12075 [Candidatus Scalindua sp. SCAELEC01]TDE63949.1 MAG: hypothetical protein D8M57_15730 [Candidatus Scalindua sp. AMX11]GJQ60251.1 MAG: hypothetical protein SCALA701_30520 [Candidatus Scalindua sp.]